MSLDVQLTTREQKKFVDSNASTAVKVFSIRGSFQLISVAIEQILGASVYNNVIVAQTSNYEEICFLLDTTLVKKIRITYTSDTSFSISEILVLDYYLLLENNDYLLLENDDKIILEAA